VLFRLSLLFLITQGTDFISTVYLDEITGKGIEGNVLFRAAVMSHNNLPVLGAKLAGCILVLFLVLKIIPRERREFAVFVLSVAIGIMIPDLVRNLTLIWS
jgi:hypothetical protein